MAANVDAVFDTFAADWGSINEPATAVGKPTPFNSRTQPRGCPRFGLAKSLCQFTISASASFPCTAYDRSKGSPRLSARVYYHFETACNRALFRFDAGSTHIPCRTRMLRPTCDNCIWFSLEFLAARYGSSLYIAVKQTHKLLVRILNGVKWSNGVPTRKRVFRAASNRVIRTKSH